MTIYAQEFLDFFSQMSDFVHCRRHKHGQNRRERLGEPYEEDL